MRLPHQLLTDPVTRRLVTRNTKMTDVLDSWEAADFSGLTPLAEHVASGGHDR
jgi:hypothetical protein